MMEVMGLADHTVSGIQDHRPVEEHYEALGRVVSDQPSDYE